MQKALATRNNMKKLLLKTMIEDIRTQIEHRGFDEIPYTVNLKHLSKKTGISPRSITCTVRDFLESRGKPYDHKQCGRNTGARYQLTVNRKELEEWESSIEKPFNY